MNIAFFNFSVKMTDADIRQAVYEATVITEKTREGVLVSIDGYDQDPRDLWNIPEVVTFAKRLVDHGVCSVATVSTTLDPKFEGPGGKPFGGFEIWLLSKGYLGRADLEGKFLEDLLQEFYQFLPVSNKVATEIWFGLVNDGQHSTRVGNA